VKRSRINEASLDRSDHCWGENSYGQINRIWCYYLSFPVLSFILNQIGYGVRKDDRTLNKCVFASLKEWIRSSIGGGRGT
jgi:hypothetical protein